MKKVKTIAFKEIMKFVEIQFWLIYTKMFLSFTLKLKFRGSNNIVIKQLYLQIKLNINKLNSLIMTFWIVNK